MDAEAVIRRLYALFGEGFQDVAGAAVSGELPIGERILNRVIAERLARSRGPVAEARVEPQDGDTLGVQFSLRVPRMLPAIRATLRIDQQPDLPHRPVLGVRWSIPAMGPLGILAGSALTFLNALPPGLRADDNRILVDLSELFRRQGAAELLRYLSRLEVHTRRGAVVVLFELRVAG